MAKNTKPPNLGVASHLLSPRCKHTRNKNMTSETTWISVCVRVKHMNCADFQLIEPPCIERSLEGSREGTLKKRDNMGNTANPFLTSVFFLLRTHELDELWWPSVQAPPLSVQSFGQTKSCSMAVAINPSSSGHSSAALLRRYFKSFPGVFHSDTTSSTCPASPSEVLAKYCPRPPARQTSRKVLAAASRIHPHPVAPLRFRLSGGGNSSVAPLMKWTTATGPLKRTNCSANKAAEALQNLRFGGWNWKPNSQGEAKASQ